MLIIGTRSCVRRLGAPSGDEVNFVTQRVLAGTASAPVDTFVAGVPLWLGFEERKEREVGRVGVPPDEHLGLLFACYGNRYLPWLGFDSRNR